MATLADFVLHFEICSAAPASSYGIASVEKTAHISI